MCSASTTIQPSSASRGSISCGAWANIFVAPIWETPRTTQAKEACKVHLAKAYTDFVASSPIEQRVFKVLKDAVKPKEEPKIPFVPLSVLTTTTADNS